MGALRKSYWTDCFIDSPRAQEAVKSWFGRLAEGLTITKAEILADVETDAEKKLRIFGVNAEGKQFRLIRVRTVRGFSLAIKALPERAAPVAGESV